MLAITNITLNAATKADALFIISVIFFTAPGGVSGGRKVSAKFRASLIALNIDIILLIRSIFFFRFSNFLILLLIKVIALFLKLVAIIIVSGVLACSI